MSLRRTAFTAFMPGMVALFAASGYAQTPAATAPNAAFAAVLEQAVENSEELGIAAQGILQTREELGMARAPYLPQVKITTKAGRNAGYPSSNRSLGDPRGASEYVNTSSSKLEVEQMLFDGFRTPAEVERQKKLLEGQEYRYRAVRNEVVQNTLNAYLLAWRNLQAMRAGVALVEQMNEVQRQVGLQAELGATDQTTQSYVDSRRTGALQELLKNKNAYRDALYRLSYLTHGELTPETFTMDALQVPSIQDIDTYLTALRQNNPKLRGDFVTEGAAKEALRRAESTLYPTLSLTSDLEDTNDVGGSNGNARIGNVLVQASYKIFDGFSASHERAKARGALLEAQLRARRTLRQMEEDTRQLLRQTQATQAEFELTWNEVQESDKVRRLRQQDVANGQGDIVRLVEAEEAYYTAVLRLIELGQNIADKRFQLAISTNTLDDLACVTGGCQGVEMQPIFPQDVFELPRDIADNSAVQVPPESAIEPAAGPMVGTSSATMNLAATGVVSDPSATLGQ